MDLVAALSYRPGPRIRQWIVRAWIATDRAWRAGARDTVRARVRRAALDVVARARAAEIQRAHGGRDWRDAGRTAGATLAGAVCATCGRIHDPLTPGTVTTRDARAQCSARAETADTWRAVDVARARRAPLGPAIAGIPGSVRASVHTTPRYTGRGAGARCGRACACECHAVDPSRAAGSTLGCDPCRGAPGWTHADVRGAEVASAALARSGASGVARDWGTGGSYTLTHDPRAGALDAAGARFHARRTRRGKRAQ